MQRPFMRRAIHAQRHAGDDGEPGLRECTAEGLGVLQAKRDAMVNGEAKAIETEAATAIDAPVEAETATKSDVNNPPIFTMAEVKTDYKASK